MFTFVSLGVTGARADEGEHSEAFEHVGVETAFVTALDEFEINLILSRVTRPDSTKREAELELQFGIWKGVMIELEAPLRSVSAMGASRRTDIGPVEFGGKFQVCAHGILHCALRAAVAAPTGIAENGRPGEGWELEASMIVSLQGERLGAHFETLTEWEFEDGLELDTARLTAALDYALPESPFSYQLAARFERRDGITGVFIAPGAKYGFGPPSAINSRSLGIGLLIGLTDHVRGWGLLLNFETEF